MRLALLTWRLTPAGKESDLWSFSSYNGEAWVRAHDAFEARSLAANRFSVDGRARGFAGRIESPWYARELVRCELSQDSRFDSIDIACVVHPPHSHLPVEDMPMPQDQSHDASGPSAANSSGEDVPTSDAQ
jgi:hypothetical protein